MAKLRPGGGRPGAGARCRRAARAPARRRRLGRRGLAWPEPTEQQAEATTQALQNPRGMCLTPPMTCPLAHAAMEPLNATVWMRGAAAEVWVSTQSQTDTQRAVAQARWASHRAGAVHSRDIGWWLWAVVGAGLCRRGGVDRRAVGRPVKPSGRARTTCAPAATKPAVASRVRLALDDAFAHRHRGHDTAGLSLLRHWRDERSAAQGL